MLKNRKLKGDSGFTIIEVLIVLAIAGLILLIVFLAVPALQRNARNTSRKVDANTALASVNEYRTNNSGGLPTKFIYINGNLTWENAGGGGNTDVPAVAHLGYYTSLTANSTTPSTGSQSNGDVQLLNGSTAQTVTGGSTKDYLSIVTQAECPGSITSQGTTAPTVVTNVGSTKEFVAIYSIEDGGGNYSLVCVQS